MAYSFFVLVDGEADVRRRNRRVATLGPGDCFGELALILRRPRTATVTLRAAPDPGKSMHERPDRSGLFKASSLSFVFAQVGSAGGR